MDDVQGFFIYDGLAHDPLRRRGVEVETLSWRAPGVDWTRFDAVVVRSTWDYQADAERFLSVLEEIASATILLNSLEVVRWNLDKRYLLDLERAGVPIVPTRVVTSATPDSIRTAAAELGDPSALIVKPTVSANADHTHRLRRGDVHALSRAVADLAGHQVLVQPFMERIVDEGELSLFYFDGRFSHAIRKIPAPDDFRVQEEHGGRLAPIDPSPELLDRGRVALRALPFETLYARIDLVPAGGDDLVLMEVELIEPSLYFQLDAGAADRFADALVRWLA
jgi:glutathione synthase/RimK-type ligase-like ATP-grasp enzyme